MLRLRRKHQTSYTGGKIKNTAVGFLQCFQEFAVQSLNKGEYMTLRKYSQSFFFFSTQGK